MKVTIFKLFIITIIILTSITAYSNSINAKAVSTLILKYEKLYKKYNIVTYRSIASKELKHIKALIDSAKKHLKQKKIERAYYEMSICPHYFKNIQEIHNLKDLLLKYNNIIKKNKKSNSEK